ncbi:MAG: aminodeoxychorismate/anthranilate synthase component II [Bacteroidota bacterium]|nr:aminodeoxychorismate/anthranilate synthase component II [Candidatus Kapabacteria bacterium]MDW8219156.1 aminodeoxychorismate/anthranilate synthase component II [Bacteroidota bacterium]
MRILLLDNYDSFTYNVAHAIRSLGYVLDVIRNDKLSLEDVQPYTKVVLSPGPGIPREAGIMPELIAHYASEKPILGICLGHQAIGEAFGGQLHNLPRVFHGVATSVHVTQHDILFEGLPTTFTAGRYHSWVVAEETLPAELEVIARDTEGHIMALRHRTYDVRGVQFHPESVLTEHGIAILRNWLTYSYSPTTATARSYHVVPSEP